MNTGLGRARRPVAVDTGTRPHATGLRPSHRHADEQQTGAT